MGKSNRVTILPNVFIYLWLFRKRFLRYEANEFVMILRLGWFVKMLALSER